MRAVLLPRRICITELTLNEDGTIKLGSVRDGLWFIRQQKGEFQAYSTKASKKPVHIWSDKQPHQLVDIPAEVTGDYSDLIAWAKNKAAGDSVSPSNGQTAHSVNQL